MASTDNTSSIPAAPKGMAMLRWIGPGFLWMVSAAGSGELLFTPRVGSIYGYSLIWALFAAVILKWFINREIGRYAVCTGTSVIDGFARLPGPRNLALWLILVPQLFVAVISVAGLAGGAATALILLLPGSATIWMIISVLLSTTLVLWGKYRGVEKASIILASALALASIVAAVSTSPSLLDLAKGLKPTLPENTDISEILPWLGFMMSGAAGLMWYSFWIPAKGYAMKNTDTKAQNETEQSSKPRNVKDLGTADINKLKGWIGQMSLDTTLAVIGTLIITISFLVLGTELLKPEGLVPEENKVASTLGRLLGDIWGPIGFWFMVVGVFIGFWDTVLSDQDGHSRLFASGTIYLFPAKTKSKWVNKKFLKRLFVVVLVTVFPIILYLVIGNPVKLLKLAGAIEAAHIPVVTALVLYLNYKNLPKKLQPSKIVFAITSLAGLFFLAFAVIYVLQLTGVVDLK